MDLIDAARARLASDRTAAYQQNQPQPPAYRYQDREGRRVRLAGSDGSEAEVRMLTSGSLRAGDPVIRVGALGISREGSRMPERRRFRPQPVPTGFWLISNYAGSTLPGTNELEAFSMQRFNRNEALFDEGVYSDSYALDDTISEPAPDGGFYDLYYPAGSYTLKTGRVYSDVIVMAQRQITTPSVFTINGTVRIFERGQMLGLPISNYGILKLNDGATPPAYTTGDEVLQAATDYCINVLGYDPTFISSPPARETLVSNLPDYSYFGGGIIWDNGSWFSELGIITSLDSYEGEETGTFSRTTMALDPGNYLFYFFVRSQTFEFFGTEWLDYPPGFSAPTGGSALTYNLAIAPRAPLPATEWNFNITLDPAPPEPEPEP